MTVHIALACSTVRSLNATFADTVKRRRAALLRAAVVGQFRRHARKRCAIWRDAVACAVMSSFITPADAKAIDKAFREYKDAEQALHKAFLYRRPIEEIGSDILTFQEKDASWASLREKFYQR